MQEQFDKRLADKIRQEMGGYDPPFNPGHWADMQKRLGRGTPNTAKRFFTVLLILLLTLVAYLPIGDITLYNNALLLSQTNSLLTEEQNNDIINADQKASLFTKESRIDKKEKGNITQKIEASSQQDFITQEELKVDDSEKSSKEISMNDKEEIINPQDTEFLVAEKSTISADVAKPAKVKLDTDFDLAINNNSALSTIENKNSNLSFGNLKLENKPIKIDSIFVNTKLISLKEDPASALNSLSNFTLSILAEGFINQNNRINNYSKPGFGFGALLNYKPSNKWMLSTGLVFEKLSGKAFPDQSEFEESASSFNVEAFPGYGAISLNDYAVSSQEKTELVTITANFTAIEIPLQFTYYLSNNNKKRFYVSSSISSYFYLLEKYNYEKEAFQLPTRSNIRKLSIVNEEVTYSAFENFDLFSNVTFSAGMERKIGLRSSLSIEPFYRLPIRKMGIENVPFYSTGIRVKYNIGR